MDYREKLAGVLTERAEVQENIGKLEDALYASTGAMGERDERRQVLQAELAEASLAASKATVDAILKGSPDQPQSDDVERITAALAALDRQDADATSLQTALRGRIAQEQSRLGLKLDTQTPIAQVVTNSPAAVALVKDTREAWVKAVAGSMALKYLTETHLLDHAEMASKAGTPATHSIELLAHLTRNNEYKRIIPDRTFDGMPSWAEAVHALQRDASALLPGEKAASSKQGGLFGK